MTAGAAVSCDVVTWLVRDADPAEVGAACAVWTLAEAARTGRHPGEVERREFVESMTAAIHKPGARLLLGLADGQVVATICGVPLRTDASKAQVTMLAVDPTLWRTGIGTKMLQELVSVLRLQGCRHLRMNVDPDNAPARALYERHGWRHTGETERVDATDVRELIYRIDLFDAEAS
jgi:ribosomal protein S18 acetylase RimI-like enzyme